MEKLLETVFTLKATDVHISVGQPPVLRVNGRMRKLVSTGARNGYFQADGTDASVVTAIRDSRPDILFVAMGAPRQEIWIAKHKEALGTALLKQVRRSPVPAYAFWALTRLGARSLLYGPLNAVVHHQVVEGWLDALLAFVDLAGLGPGRYNLPVRLEPPQGAAIVRSDPATVRVRIR